VAFPSSAKFSGRCTSETNTLKEAAVEWNLMTSQEGGGRGGVLNNRHVITLLAFQMTSPITNAFAVITFVLQ